MFRVSRLVELSLSMGGDNTHCNTLCNGVLDTAVSLIREIPLILITNQLFLTGIAFFTD